MTNIQLVPLKRHQLETLENLMQLYLYDFSIYFCDEPTEQIGENGRYDPGYGLERYLKKSGYSAYLGRVDGKLAGFVLTSSRIKYREGAGRSVDEFFVLRCYRRQGVGRALALQTFEAFTGYWEIAEVADNTPAQAFWRRVIGEYTGGRYRELTGEFGEIWQTFDSSVW